MIWVIGGFSISVLITIYFIEHKLASEKWAQMVALMNDNCCIKITDHWTSFVPF